MSLFNKKNSSGAKVPAQPSEAQGAKKNAGAAVKILGGGCPKCNQLEANAVDALSQLNMDTTVDHVRDYAEIASYGVMSTPALVYNGRVLCYGKVCSAAEIVQLIKKQLP